MLRLNLRERLGVGAAVAVVLILGLGSCAYSRAGMPTEKSAAALAPVGADGHAASLEILAGGKDEHEAVAPTPPSAAASVAGTPSDALVVHVVGAVRHPGVYRLRLGDRIVDAVHAAGGFRSGAAEDVLNLADAVRDADQIYIPTQSEAASSGAASPADGGGLAALEKPSRSRSTSRRGYSGASASRRGRRTAPYIVRGMSPRGTTPSVQISPVVLTPPRPMTPLPGITYAPGDGAGAAIPTPGITVQPGALKGGPPVVIGRVLGRPAPIAAVATVAAVGEGGDDSAEAAADSVVLPAAPIVVGKRSSSGGGKKGSGGASKKFKAPGDGIVHLNSATAAQLEFIPGIGPSTAQKVLLYRAQIGRFTDVSQIMDVSGIGEKKFAKMQPFLAL